MNKKLMVSLLAVGVLTSSTAFANQNPFETVQKDYWAYTAVEKLVQDGLVDGYDLSDFHDKKVVARYDVAQFVARAMANEENASAEDKELLNKLKQEYDNELKIMTVVPVQQVVKETKTVVKESSNEKIKWFGDDRIRYQRNYKVDMPRNYKGDFNKDKIKSGSSRIQNRLRVGFYAEPDKNLSVLGRIKIEDTSHDNDGWGNKNKGDNHGSANLDLLALTWKQDKTAVTLGRQNLNIGQGLIWWDNPVDGLFVTQDLGNNSSIQAGWGDLTAENWNEYSMNAFIANAKVGVSDNTNVTLGYLKTNSNKNRVGGNRYKPDEYNWYEWRWQDSPYLLEQIALGVNSQLSDKVNLTVEGITNRASGLPDDAQKNGWWTRLTYGKQDWTKKDSWKAYFDYMSFGNYSVDSTGWGHILNTPGGNGLGGDGEKGYGLGFSYMLAANTNIDLNWYKLRPYDSSVSSFSDYKDMYNLSFIYSF